MLFRQNRADFAYYAKHMHGEAVAEASVEAVWREVASIGGANGYYYLQPLWVVRGWLDRWSGGTGLTRGRRDPHDVAVGDAIDFWRVVDVEPRHRMTLLAEMRLPGAAALTFDIEALAPQRTRIVVTASFHPAGFKGLMYWHALAPAHAFIFPGLARAIGARAVAGRHDTT
jgi:hypothetical protein